MMWSQTSASETCTTNVTANDTIESVAMILWLDKWMVPFYSKTYIRHI